MQHRGRGSQLLLAAAVGMISILPAHAQTADTGVGIAEFSGGGIFGLGAHGNVGGSLWVPTSKYAVPVRRIFVFAACQLQLYYGVNDTGEGLFISQLWDLNSGIKFRFPSKEELGPPT